MHHLQNKQKRIQIKYISVSENQLECIRILLIDFIELNNKMDHNFSIFFVDDVDGMMFCNQYKQDGGYNNTNRLVV